MKLEVADRNIAEAGTFRDDHITVRQVAIGEVGQRSTLLSRFVFFIPHALIGQDRPEDIEVPPIVSRMPEANQMKEIL
jgi:hypothetical protein